MQCEKFEARLNELLDEHAPLELDGALRAHYRSCAECRALFAAYRELMHTVQFSPLPEPPGGLTDAIVSAALREARATVSSTVVPRRSALRKWAVRKWSLGVAAAVAVALLVAVTWKFVGRPDRVTDTPTLVEKDQESGADLSALAQDATSRYWKLAQETRKEVIDALAILPRVNVKAPAASLLEESVPLQGKSKEMAVHVVDTLKPLARSTQDTFGFLFGSSWTDNGEM